MTSRGSKYWESGSIPLIGPDILGNIITEVSDLGIVINDDGTVLSLLVNPQYDMYRRLQDVEGKDLRTTLTKESRVKFDERLATFTEQRTGVRPIELNHTDASGRSEFPVRYSFHSIGPDGAILLLGRDLRPVAEMQQQLVKAQMALERDYEVQREFETRFRVLMENTTDAMILASLQSGRIVDVNSRAVAILGQPRDRLIDADFSTQFDNRKRGDVLDRLTTFALSESDDAFVVQSARSSEKLQLHPTAFRVAGERLVMCRITRTDVDQAETDPLSDNLRQLYLRGPDAIVFADESGTILSANDCFLDLLGAANDTSVRGESLANFLQRGSVDFKVMCENAARTGKMRMYATKIAGDYGSPRNVEVSVCSFTAGAVPVFAFTIREASRTDAQGSQTNPIDDGMQSVMELVGSATLKDIVAETTNVVEKMCIETAIELTMNNRVAAAEMLGLSRQSLYVKLRKFGILARDTDGD